MRQFRKATIRQVAAKAGVSCTTVSLFMNGRVNVCSPETAERIRKAVTVLNYTPNSLTKGLRKGELITIGVCMQNPSEDDYAFGSLYLEQLWRGIMQQADLENYSLLRYPQNIRDGVTNDAFLDGRIDGILLHDHNNGRAEYLRNAGMPAVLMDRPWNVPDGCGSAYANQADVVDLALSYLWELGHRRIAHVAGPVGERAGGIAPPDVITALPWADHVAVHRLEYYSAWLKQRDAFDPDLIAYAQAWSAPNAAQNLQCLFKADRPPTAIFCSNDAQAAEIITAAAAMGLQVPRDLSVVGVDDSLIARSHLPLITSVKVPMVQVGQEAVSTLLRLLRGAPLDECRVAVPATNLVVRDSTAPPKSG